MVIDNISPPGAYEREWDAKSHTETEYRQEIREMRERIRIYLKEIALLQDEILLLREQLHDLTVREK